MMGLSPKYDLGFDRLWHGMPVPECCLSIHVVLTEVALQYIHIRCFHFICNLCATPTPAIIVRYNRV